MNHNFLPKKKKKLFLYYKKIQTRGKSTEIEICFNSTKERMQVQVVQNNELKFAHQKKDQLLSEPVLSRGSQLLFRRAQLCQRLDCDAGGGLRHRQVI